MNKFCAASTPRLHPLFPVVCSCYRQTPKLALLTLPSIDGEEKETIVRKMLQGERWKSEATTRKLVRFNQNARVP